VPPAGEERAVSDPGFAMVDFATNRLVLPCVTDFGKTTRMDSPTVKRFLPWVVALALFMEQLDSTIVNTAVPSMAASLHVTPLSLKAVVASYILSLAVCIPVSGWIADRYGTRRVFAIAIAVFTISSVFCGLAMNLPQMVAARILQGIGAAMMMPVGRLTVIRTFPKAELLQAMNFVIIPALIGPLLGPTVGGLIVHWFSWREIFRECSGGRRRAVAHSSLYAGLLWRYLAPARCGLAQFGAGAAVLSCCWRFSASTKSTSRWRRRCLCSR
jgi:MFS family permease